MKKCVIIRIQNNTMIIIIKGYADGVVMFNSLFDSNLKKYFSHVKPTII